MTPSTNFSFDPKRRVSKTYINSLIRDIHKNPQGGSFDLLMKELTWVFAYALRDIQIPVDMDKEDLFQEFRLMVWRALKTFDENRNTNLATYICRYLRKNMIDIINKTKSNELYLDELIVMDGDKPLTKEIASPESKTELIDNIQLQYLVSTLKPRYQEIISLWACGYTCAEIAKQQNVSASMIYQIRERALELMKEKAIEKAIWL